LLLRDGRGQFLGGRLLLLLLMVMVKVAVVEVMVVVVVVVVVELWRLVYGLRVLGGRRRGGRRVTVSVRPLDDDGVAGARERVDGDRIGRGCRLRVPRVVGRVVLRMLLASAVLLLVAGVVQLHVADAPASGRERVVVELVLQAERLLDAVLQVVVLHLQTERLFDFAGFRLLRVRRRRRGRR